MKGGVARFVFARVGKHMGIKRCFQLEICLLTALREYWCDGARQATTGPAVFRRRACCNDVRPEAFHFDCESN
jgi:hypothetical protein